MAPMTTPEARAALAGALERQAGEFLEQPESFDSREAVADAILAALAASGWTLRPADDDLGAAWEAAEAALPKIRKFDRGKRVPDEQVAEHWTLEVRSWGAGQYTAHAHDPTEDTERQAWLGLTAAGHGPTPAAALRELAVSLAALTPDPGAGG